MYNGVFTWSVILPNTSNMAVWGNKQKAPSFQSVFTFQLWKLPLFILVNLCSFKAVAILPSTAIYPQRLFCRELFVIGQS